MVEDDEYNRRNTEARQALENTPWGINMTALPAPSGFPAVVTVATGGNLLTGFVAAERGRHDQAHAIDIYLGVPFTARPPAQQDPQVAILSGYGLLSSESLQQIADDIPPDNAPSIRIIPADGAPPGQRSVNRYTMQGAILAKQLHEKGISNIEINSDLVQSPTGLKDISRTQFLLNPRVSRSVHVDQNSQPKPRRGMPSFVRNALEAVGRRFPPRHGNGPR